MNAKMSALRAVFEHEGFGNVKTVLASGNVVFDAPEAPNEALEAQIMAALEAKLAHGFDTIVRPQRHLQELLERNPFATYQLAPDAKCVVTFLRQPPAAPVALPLVDERVKILEMTAQEVFTTYLPTKQPRFMKVLERTFGKAITTRTWQTVTRCSKA